MPTVPQLIEDWKKKLLDLSKRNNLLNFRTTRRGTLRVIYPDFPTLFSSLIDGKDLWFAKPSQAEEFELFGDDSDTGEDMNFTIKSSAATLKEETTTLKGLRRRAKTIMEEQGINVLHVAFGIVNWKESPDSEDVMSSPLLLFPVSLQINSVVDPFVLSSNEDDVTVNPTLRYKLEHDFNIILPEFDDNNSVEAYIRKCENIFSEHPDWHIEREAYLSIFSFLKINMYYDLAGKVDEADKNDIIQSFAGNTSRLTKLDDIVCEMVDIDYDKDIHPKDVFQVLDADASQQEAIELAKRGASFVLQGPPGTGKSQTITNIIAESLAAGKTVLFVSEKEAALNVVKNRLGQTHILDFCLPMHSHKANKKEIINELYRTAELSRVRVKDNEIIKLEKLYNNRLKLDQISEELHRPIPPLNLSVFETNSELAIRESTPYFLFSLQDINKYTIRKLAQIDEGIGLLKNNVERFSGDRFSPLWNENILLTLTNELKHTFKATITEKLSQGIRDIDTELHTLTGTSRQILWFQLKQFVVLLECCSNAVNLPEAWLNENLYQLDALIKKWGNAFNVVSADRKIVEGNCSGGVVRFNSAPLANDVSRLAELVSSYTDYNLSNKEAEQYHDEIIDLQGNGKRVLEWVDSFVSSLQAFLGAGVDYAKILFSQTTQLYEVCNALVSAGSVNREWYTRKNAEEIQSLIEGISEKNTSEGALRKRILTQFDKEIFDVNVKGLLPKFRTTYASIFRVFKSEYKKDLHQLTACCKTGKLSYSDALSLLNDLNKISEIGSWFEENNELLRRYFGARFNSKSFDKEKSLASLSKACLVIDFFHDNVPEGIKQLTDVGFYNSDSSKSKLDVLAVLTTDSVSKKAISLLTKAGIDESLFAIKERGNKVDSLASSILLNWDDLNSYSEKGELSLSVLDPLMTWQKFLGEFDYEAQMLAKRLSSEFNGIDTDWAACARKLSWLKQYKSLSDELIPDTIDFAKKLVSDDDIRIRCKEVKDSINQFVDNNETSINNFDKWFPESHSIRNDSLPDMKKIIDYYLVNIEYLDSWLAYKKVYRDLDSLGLGDFLKTVVDSPDVSACDYQPIFTKRFYAIWLDYAKAQLPLLSTISQIELDTILQDFKHQDKQQFAIAQARINEILSDNLPNTTLTATANDQLGILKREYYKQRRQIPIRKLFNAIPELVMRIKPCLMMSPLSVSLFLENPSYLFDVVIFDEASQVKPENAIGSIIRGKQIIVAGDTHQLPPTNFFQASLTDDDLYSDEVDDDFGLEESILDACARVLPERYLKWHYRSRHEHLIAFSNAKIYDSRLTTFPSSIDKEKDMGVEFVYVKNGVYERGGKKNNPLEAEIVANIVFDHFKKHPNRSLGVIANSESQAHTIEEIVTRKRAQHTAYERYFSEDKEEPFFIKSLESVQGDERDTIIFSIGYGKDANGKMTQNFGPINRDGGERRLNVAVTRAKFNFKLVSSITAADIEVSESTKEGPKLLKAYIDFAQRGIVALNAELEEGHGLDFDSPFEESVYNFLTENGYKVESQVGCAGYRIDLGVKDPDNPGRYVLAVECDGATYHSSRTARERDRLRQQVLENMGWHFHRVWSTDWIQNTATAKSALIQAVKEAIFNAPNSGHLFPVAEFEQNSMNSFIDEVEPKDEEKDINSVLGFEEYIFAEGYESPYKYLRDNILTLLQVESPVHFNYLCRKMAPALQREKASSYVQDQVLHDLSWMNKKEQIIDLDGDFIYLKPRKQEYVMRINSGRDITEICPEELEYAMISIAQNAIGITKDSLIDETAHSIGYKHSKDKIKACLNVIFNNLLKDGKIVISPSGGVSSCCK